MRNSFHLLKIEFEHNVGKIEIKNYRNTVKSGINPSNTPNDQFS